MKPGLFVQLLIILAMTVRAMSQDAPTTAPAGRGGRGGAPRVPINPALPTLWIIGDSTVKNGADTGGNGQWGWGNPIAAYFDQEKINVQNRALGGTSSRTFYRDNWPRILPEIKQGDFLIMQFGHNDSSPVNDNSRARGTMRDNGDEVQEIDNMLTGKHEIVHSYGWYLRTMIAEARARGVVLAMVCSPIPRNNWPNGKMIPSNYNEVAEAAAKQVNAVYIDLNERVIKKYEPLGQEKVTELYFPEKETTHPDWAGAILNAECVIECLKDINSPLARYLKPVSPTGLKNPTGKAR
ncbi:MAG TPA: GDSL-type esterase/lipase family protein [Tepidisphaeraceae bacterium]|nr:GDSL-type esterase/lipase family protein [Tepidisphaeraceae bacterium]